MIKHDTPVNEAANYLYGNASFGKPKMILSVTGGAKRFTIDENTKTAFKRGLVKVAKTTDSWIISGGTDVGVMRLVGDAIDEDLCAQDLTVLGIACLRRIAVKQKMTQPQALKNEKVTLNIFYYFS